MVNAELTKQPTDGTECPYKTEGAASSQPQDKVYEPKIFHSSEGGVTLAQLVKASVGQADVRRFEPHLGHNWLSCVVFLVKSRHFRLPLAQTIRPDWQSLLAGGSEAIQTWSIYKVYT